jgi:CheY-like chemotaxis protein/HPt (histidine-containing phosphotransfer) domain-containing protein
MALKQGFGDTAGPRAASILVVEDYPANQKVARLHLERAGHRVTLSGNGQEALGALARERFDLVFMDIQMPIMDGIEATRRIRGGFPNLAALPIIAMTASADPASRQACQEAGMNDVVTKPIRRETLLAAVDRWTRGAPATTFTEAIGGEADGAAEPPIDFATAVEEFGDEATVRQVLGTFLDIVKGQLTTLDDALARRDSDVLRREAHSIKGGAATLEARPLAAAAAMVETLAAEGRFDAIGAHLATLAAAYAQLRSAAGDGLTDRGGGQCAR